MKKTSKLLAFALLILALTVFMTNCGGGGGGGGDDDGGTTPQKTQVTVQVNGPTDLERSLSDGLLTAASIPSQVGSVVLEVRTPDCSSAIAYTSTANVSGGQESVTFNFSLTSGTTACFTAKAYSQADGTGTLLYEGTTSGVYLEPDQSITVEINVSLVGTIPPTATTNAATNVASTSATLNGQINPNGYQTVAYFEWGLTTAYGSSTPIKNVGYATGNIVVSQLISGLSISTTYHYRIVASNSGNIVYGSDQQFTTLTANTGGSVIITFPNIPAPNVTTNAATNITKNSAQLNGTVNPQGTDTKAYLEWGTTTSYGNTTSLQTIGSGFTGTAISASISGLSLLTQYHYRAVAFNAGGLTVGADMTFTTSDGTWQTATLIETDNAGDAFSPQIAIDPNRNATAVWHQYDGTRYNIWANRYVAGAGWGAAQLIETDNAGGVYYPQIAIDPNGNAIAVWFQYDDVTDNGSIWSNRYTAGAGWGAAQLIETDNAGGAYYPQIAIDPNGNAIAVWHQYDGTRYNIWVNRYVAGTGWETPQFISTDNSGGSSPQIAFDGSGNAIAVWCQNAFVGNQPTMHIWANRYIAGTGWETPQFIETGNASEPAVSPQIAFDGSGNAIAVWAQSDGAMSNIWANRYVAGSGWGTATLIETDDTGSAGYPQIAIDLNGNAIAVWWQSDGTMSNIWANRYIKGSGWETPQLIETDNSGNAYYSPIAFDGSGNAIAVWQQSDGTRYNIWANRFE